MLDRYHVGVVDRISPEAPVPILEVKNTFERLGAAANVAAGVVAMGVSCTLGGVVGNDTAGQRLFSLLEKQDINNACVIYDKTIIKERVIADHQQICRLDFESSLENFTDYSSLLERISSSVYSAIIFCDYNKGASNILPEVFKLASCQKIPVFIDPKKDNWDIYVGAFCVKPNWKEFLMAAQYLGFEGGVIEDHIWVEKVSRALSEHYHISHIIITLGQKGYVHISPNNIIWKKTRALEVFDLSGAGDTFIATMAAFFVLGESMEKSAQKGNCAAGVSVSRLGTTVIGLEDLQVDQPNHIIIRRIRHLSKFGKRIVFTNGCFDLLHYGHLYVLEEARKYGDILVVGVNSDCSVKRLKGDTRPIIPCNERIAMLKALRVVDFVLPFTEDTPWNLIRLVKPDVLVKGGDYTVNTVIGSDLMDDGQVIIVPFQKNYSTSAIIDYIYKSKINL